MALKICMILGNWLGIILAIVLSLRTQRQDRRESCRGPWDRWNTNSNITKKPSRKATAFPPFAASVCFDLYLNSNLSLFWGTKTLHSTTVNLAVGTIYKRLPFFLQLRCGWRPGHISCPVLRKIEQHNCMKCGACASCASPCGASPCSKPCVVTPKCATVCPSSTSCCKQPPCTQPLIRVIRHGGQYSICTKPSNISNAPSGPYPLKYVLNAAKDEEDSGKTVKYSVQAKFNDYLFDYTSSQSSFVLDFSPPEQKCYKPCPKKSILCMLCQTKTPGPTCVNKVLE